MKTENSYVSNHKDFSVVKNPARIAVYDNLKVPPRMVTIQPAPTAQFIENLASNIYELARKQNGRIPYTTIREITENFIHADFSEIIVSVLDNGNTIRFADQGPGFNNIENAKLPGFSSATEPMKQYIRGVGSGLPTVNEYMNISDGALIIENNLTAGAVVTISALKNLRDSSAFSDETKKQSNKRYKEKFEISGSSLNSRQTKILFLIFKDGPQGVSEISKACKLANSTVHKDLTYLEEKKLLKVTNGKKRVLTDLGISTCKALS